MRFKERLVILALLALASVIQVAWYYLLRSGGLPNSSAALVLLTLFPGGLGWYAAFAYAFRVLRARARASRPGGA